MLVILGTAHLSSTSGKCSPDKKFKEYKYSREICVAVANELTSRGIHTTIDYLDDDMPGKTSSQELCERVNIVNNYCKEHGDCIYVSIHVNAAGCDGQWKNATGWSIYTSPGVTKSDDIANSMYCVAKKILDPLKKKIRTDFADGDADYEENFYVLKKTTCPAVLTENFFQDCKTDVEWLESEEGRRTIIDIHVEGICEYLKSL